MPQEKVPDERGGALERGELAESYLFRANQSPVGRQLPPDLLGEGQSINFEVLVTIAETSVNEVGGGPIRSFPFITVREYSLGVRVCFAGCATVRFRLERVPPGRED